MSKNIIDPTKYKTELCKNYDAQRHKKCPSFIKCRFAHGKGELRTVEQNKLDGLFTEDAIVTFQRRNQRRQYEHLNHPIDMPPVCRGNCQHHQQCPNCAQPPLRVRVGETPQVYIHHFDPPQPHAQRAHALPLPQQPYAHNLPRAVFQSPQLYPHHLLQGPSAPSPRAEQYAAPHHHQYAQPLAIRPTVEFLQKEQAAQPSLQTPPCADDQTNLRLPRQQRQLIPSAATTIQLAPAKKATSPPPPPEVNVPPSQPQIACAANSKKQTFTHNPYAVDRMVPMDIRQLPTAAKVRSYQ